MAKHPVALQLYSLREDAAHNFMGVLERTAKLGYQGVEFAGFGGLEGRELKLKLDELGMEAVGAHIGFDQLKTDLAGIARLSHEVGIPHVVCPAPYRGIGDTADSWKEFGRQLNDIGQALAKEGLRFGYHNHSFEFKQYDGAYGLDLLFAETDPENVFAELDLGWVFHAKVDPISYLEKYADRCPLVHIKDFQDDGKQVEVGTGDLDLTGVLRASQTAGVEWLIIETEEYTMPPIDSVRVGLENVLETLEKLG